MPKDGSDARRCLSLLLRRTSTVLRCRERLRHAVRELPSLPFANVLLSLIHRSVVNVLMDTNNRTDGRAFHKTVKFLLERLDLWRIQSRISLRMKRGRDRR